MQNDAQFKNIRQSTSSFILKFWDIMSELLYLYTNTQNLCSDLNKNIPPPQFRCLNTCSPFDGDVSVVLGEMALFQEVCHWRWALDV